MTTNKKDKSAMFDGGEDSKEKAENARLKALFGEGKCFVNPCGDYADYELTDADNNDRPFLMCESHHDYLNEKANKITKLKYEQWIWYREDKNKRKVLQELDKLAEEQGLTGPN